MRLINLTKVRRKRLLEMLTGLITEYKSIKIVKAKGLPVVVFKKAWWKFWTRYTVNITDVCITEIPKRLDKLAQDKKLGKYRDFFNNIIFDIVAYKENPHTQYVDIVDYLYENYTKIYYSEETIVLPVSRKLVLMNNDYSVALFNKPVFAYSIRDIIKEVPEYFKFSAIKTPKIYFLKEKAESLVKNVTVNVSSKLRSVNINLGLRTALD